MQSMRSVEDLVGFFSATILTPPLQMRQTRSLDNGFFYLLSVEFFIRRLPTLHTVLTSSEQKKLELRRAENSQQFSLSLFFLVLFFFLYFREIFKQQSITNTT